MILLARCHGLTTVTLLQLLVGMIYSRTAATTGSAITTYSTSVPSTVASTDTTTSTTDTSTDTTTSTTDTSTGTTTSTTDTSTGTTTSTTDTSIDTTTPTTDTSTDTTRSTTDTSTDTTTSTTDTSTDTTTDTSTDTTTSTTDTSTDITTSTTDTSTDITTSTTDTSTDTTTSTTDTSTDITTSTTDTSTDTTTSTTMVSTDTTTSTTDTSTDITTSTTDTSTDTTTSTTDTSTDTTTSTTDTSTDITTSTTQPVTTRSTPTLITTTIKPNTLKFVNVSLVVTLNVKETQNKVLEVIVCNDTANSPNPIKVSLVRVTPVGAGCSNCFQILPCMTDWCLKFIPNVGTLDIRYNDKYYLDITCEDPYNSSIHWSLEVRLTTNTPPVFNHSGIFVSDSINNTRHIKSGEAIYHVLAIDPENNILHYSMTRTPENGNFKIGEFDGVIRATNDLAHECSQVVTFEVFVTDNFNPIVGPLIIKLTLNDSNIAPTILNMGVLIQVKEDTKILDSIYQIRGPPASSSTISYILTTSPNQAKAFFNISSSNIVLISQLDYEHPIGGYNRIMIMVNAVDNASCSSGIKTLTVDVTDVNEPPTIMPDTWTATENEGSIFIKPMWNVDDPESYDTKFYSILNASTPNSFTVNALTGDISSIGDLDADTSPRTQSVTVYILVKDKGGLNATGKLIINIIDVNDNAPVITSTTRTTTVSECSPIGFNITRLTATDADSPFQGNDATYFVMQSTTYFTLLSSGEIILSSPIQSGNYSSATVYANDKGLYPNPLRSSPAFVTVVGGPCPTTTIKTTTTTTAKTTPTTTAALTSTKSITVSASNVEYNFMTENMPWMMISALLCTCFLGLAIFMSCRYARPSCSNPTNTHKRFAEPQLVQSANSAEPKVPHASTKALPSTHKAPLPRQPSGLIDGSDQRPPLFNFWSSGIWN